MKKEIEDQLYTYVTVDNIDEAVEHLDRGDKVTNRGKIPHMGYFAYTKTGIMLWQSNPSVE